jgi:hypothetical protein
LATFNTRFAERSLLQLFVYCAFPIHVWTIVNMFLDIPAWLVYMTSWELVGTIAYTLTFALLETLVVFTPLLVVGVFLPHKWYGEWFLAAASLLLLESALLAIGLHALILNDLPKRKALLGFGFFALFTTLVVPRFPNINRGLRALADRLWILTSIYLSFDILGFVIVFVRNVWGG